MVPIKLENGIASVDVSKKRTLTARQLATLDRTKVAYGPEAAKTYLETLMGLTKRPVNVSRPRPSRVGYDRLNKRPNQVLDKFKLLLNCDSDIDHIPSKRNMGRWVGIEIECFYSYCQDCMEDCNHDNDECYGSHSLDEETAHCNLRHAIRKAKIPRASVKSDGSLSSDEGIGVEITLLFNTADGFKPLERLCEVLSDHGCFVNDTCGLHVHLDVRHLKKSGAMLVGKRLGRALPVLKWMVDDTRHNNTYCKLQVGPMSRTNESRYHAINMNAYFRYNTVEVRMHGGSTNARKIKCWIELLQCLSVTKNAKELNTFQDFVDLGLPDRLVEYAEKRITRLNPYAWAKLMPVTREPIAVELGITPLLDGPDRTY